MAIGPVLKEARLKKQLTTSQVAEQTRMKMQIVEDLERDDFHRIAATIYGKGFIKLFAECVGLNPAPLVAEYMRSVKGGPDPDVRQAIVAAAASATGLNIAATEMKIVDTDESGVITPAAPAEPEDLFTFANSRRSRITPAAPHSRPAEDGPTRSPLAPVIPAKHRTQSERTPFSIVLKDIWQTLRDRGLLLIEAVKTRLAGFKWSDRFIKGVGIAIAVLVLTGVLITVIRHLVAGSGPRPPADNELILFTDPPEPYIE